MKERTMFDAPPESTDVVLLITGEQKAMIMNELKKLFVFHGKRMSDEERGMFASDLCSANVPYKAILAGLRELQESKSKTCVEYWAIKEACQHAAAQDFQPDDCGACAGTGYVTMIRGEGEFRGYQSSFACICPNGNRHVKSSPRTPVWNGLAVQDMVDRAGGRRLALRFHHWPRNTPRPQI